MDQESQLVIQSLLPLHPEAVEAEALDHVSVIVRIVSCVVICSLFFLFFFRTRASSNKKEKKKHNLVCTEKMRPAIEEPARNKGAGEFALHWTPHERKTYAPKHKPNQTVLCQTTS